MTRAEGAPGVKDERTEGVSAAHLCENLETLTWQLGNQLLESSRIHLFARCFTRGNVSETGGFLYVKFSKFPETISLQPSL